MKPGRSAEKDQSFPCDIPAVQPPDKDKRPLARREESWASLVERTSRTVTVQAALPGVIHLT